MPDVVSPDILIIGVGNEFRGDDGSGLLVVRGISPVDSQSVQIIELPGEGTELMQVWQGREIVIVVDASQSGAQPGSIVRLDASDTRLPAGFFSYSTHAFGLAEAVETSRNLNTLPKKLIVFAVEGTAFGQGAKVTKAVQKSIHSVRHAVLNEIRGN